MMVMDLEGLCSYCYEPYADKEWCKVCNTKWFQQDFPNWTSGNEFIDRFIQETQLDSWYKAHILEWIPYNNLQNIEYLDKGI